MAAVKIGINGFGRIGRMVARAMALRKGEFDIVGINDVGSTPRTHAHLFKYDTVHGKWNGEVGHDETGLIIDGDRIRLTTEKDPSKLPWKELGAVVVAPPSERSRLRPAWDIADFTVQGLPARLAPHPPGPRPRAPLPGGRDLPRPS